MIRAHNDKDKVIVLQTSQTHLPESSGLSLITLTLHNYRYRSPRFHERFGEVTFHHCSVLSQNRKGTEGQLGGTTCPRFFMRMR